MSRYYKTFAELRISGPTPEKNRSEGTVAMPPEKTAAWPSVPGRTQPRSRMNGTKKVKTRMYQTGV